MRFLLAVAAISGFLAAAAAHAAPLGHVKTTASTQLFPKPDERIVWYDAKSEAEAAQKKQLFEAQKKANKDPDLIMLGGAFVARPQGKPIATGLTLPIVEVKKYDHEEQGARYLIGVEVDGKPGWVDASDVELLDDAPGDLAYNAYYVTALPPEWVCELPMITMSGEASEKFLARTKKESEWTAQARARGAAAFWAAGSMYKDLASPQAKALFVRGKKLLAGLNASTLSADDKDQLAKTKKGLDAGTRADYAEQCKDRWIAPGAKATP
jgi:hypothetical protein